MKIGCALERMIIAIPIFIIGVGFGIAAISLQEARPPATLESTDMIPDAHWKIPAELVSEPFSFSKPVRNTADRSGVRHGDDPSIDGMDVEPEANRTPPEPAAGELAEIAEFAARSELEWWLRQTLAQNPTEAVLQAERFELERLVAGEIRVRNDAIDLPDQAPEGGNR